MDALAAWCDSRLDAPDAVACSPSARTTETLAPFLSLWPQLNSQCVYPRSLYGASAGALMRTAEEYLEDRDSLLMVGHNPGFEDLAFSLMPERHRSDYWKMATGTLAVFDIASWPDPRAADIQLRHWITRHDLSVA
jgi:phosphohistidine phosphatase